MLDLYIEKKPIEKKKVNKIMLRSDMPFYILTPNYDRDKKRRYIITGITEEEETIIDNQQVLCLERGITFVINPNDIEAYGVIDFNDDSEDMDVIMGFRFFTSLDTIGMWLPSNYNYKEHCAYSDLAIPRIYDTLKPELIAQYGHGCIGKPERCVIFKHMFY